jgi:murein DD-endopeptidase MepM/ murein hydrolase activator NlpD
MFLLSSIQTVILGVISLFLPLAFSGVKNNGDYSCFILIEEEEVQETGNIIIAGNFEEISREEYHLLHEMGWPVINPVISSTYGYRSSCKQCSSFHGGVDFTPGRGTPVMSAMRGVVVKVEDSGQYGVHVIIKHDLHKQVWHTVYAHMQRGSVPIEIKPGTSVEIGDVIGKVGSTGLSTGPHLHFEVRVDGIKVNPMPLLYKNVPSN